MIVNGDFKLEIGQRAESEVSNGHGTFHQIPFVVIREATREEYLKYCQETAMIPVIEHRMGPYFYEITTD